MEETYEEIEVHAAFRRIEIERDVPEPLKIIAAGNPEISGLVNDPTARLVETQSSSYLARTKLVDGVYVNTFVKLGGIAVCLDPEADWNTNLPIYCATRGIIKHVSLQMRGERVWVYTGKNDLSPFALMKEMQSSGLPPMEVTVQENPLQEFFRDVGVGWDTIDEVDLSEYTSYGIFASVDINSFAAKIDRLRQFMQANHYFGFVSPLLEDHPEHNFRLPVYGYVK